MKNILIIIIIGGCIATISAIMQSTSIASGVQNGSKILTCDINNQYKVIPPSKVVGFNDSTGYWIFTNGYARQCVVSKKGL